MLVECLRKLVEGEGLTATQAEAVMAAIMDGEATQAQMGAVLAALRLKRETVDELTGFARAMRARSIAVAPRRRPLLDMCGTGGDTAGTFNVSTAAMFVVAGAGVAVAKHGNRGVSSKCGSADVLGALGVQQTLTPAQVAQCIDTVGVGFLFAPYHHPAMKNAGQTRRELGIRTVFNVLGPLTNPAGATLQLIGVFHPDLCPKLAETLGRLGCERAMVVHGMDGLDEVSTVGATRISHLRGGRVINETRMPAELGLRPAALGELAGGATAEENAGIVRSVLQGEQGPRADIVCANASAALMVAGAADDWHDGIAQARRVIAAGRAAKVLDNLVAFTQRCAEGGI